MMKSLFLICMIFSCFLAGAQVPKDGEARGETMFSLVGCGFTGRNTEKYEELLKLVSEKNVSVLFAWRRSDDIGIQLYAVEGYKRLGVDLNEPTKAAITGVINRKSKVSSCEGCFITYRSVELIAQQNGYFDLIKK